MILAQRLLQADVGSVLKTVEGIEEVIDDDVVKKKDFEVFIIRLRDLNQDMQIPEIR